MSGRSVRRYVEDLLAGRRPGSFRPDEAEAEQMRTAIDLRAARPGDDVPDEAFVADLHRRLAAEIDGSEPDRAEPDRAEPDRGETSRRVVLIGTSIAAAAATVGAVVDRTLFGRPTAAPTPPAAEAVLSPTNGAWRAVAASADLPDGGVVRFDVGTVTGFVRRVDGQPQAVSGVCTHQGCRLWLDAPADTLRCPCHATSFSTDGRVLTHQLPIAPAPLPRVQVRENGGTIEVFAPTEPA